MVSLVTESHCVLLLLFDKKQMLRFLVVVNDRQGYTKISSSYTRRLVSLLNVRDGLDVVDVMFAETRNLPLPDVRHYDAVLLGGSSAIPTSASSLGKYNIEIHKACVEAKIPCVCICYAAQVVAEAHGGYVIKKRAHRHKGCTPQHTWHDHSYIITKPPSTEAIEVVDIDEHTLAVQHHPSMSKAGIQQLIHFLRRKI